MSSGVAFAPLRDRLPVPMSQQLVLTPNCSLTPRTARLFLIATGGLTFLIAGILALQGLWPILPFAGLEIALLVWATLHSMRRGKERETLEISESEVTVCSIRDSRQQITVFPRHWAKVKLHAPQHVLHPSRLCIESHGRACEVGRFLTEDERRGVAARLRQLIGNVSESPELRA